MTYRGGGATMSLKNRPVKPTFPRKTCDNREHHKAHLWQELHIPTGNPLVEHTQWWQCGEEGKPTCDHGSPVNSTVESVFDSANGPIFIFQDGCQQYPSYSGPAS
jgi:hypothetical protein